MEGSFELLVRQVVLICAASWGTAVKEILHHYHQLAGRVVGWYKHLGLRGAVGVRRRAAVLVRVDVRESANPPRRRDDFNLKETEWEKFGSIG